MCACVSWCNELVHVSWCVWKLVCAESSKAQGVWQEPQTSIIWEQNNSAVPSSSVAAPAWPSCSTHLVLSALWHSARRSRKARAHRGSRSSRLGRSQGKNSSPWSPPTAAVNPTGPNKSGMRPNHKDFINNTNTTEVMKS